MIVKKLGFNSNFYGAGSNAAAMLRKMENEMIQYTKDNVRAFIFKNPHGSTETEFRVVQVQLGNQTFDLDLEAADRLIRDLIDATSTEHRRRDSMIPNL